MTSSHSSHKSILGAFEKLSAEAIHVHQERCAKVRNRNVECLKCAEACTTGCISLVEGALHIDSSKCVACGTCATVCPTCALEARHPSDAELRSIALRARHNDEVSIVCSQLSRALGPLLDQSKVAEVVCLGRVDESLVVDLVAQGVRRVHLACGNCGQCEQKHGKDVANIVAETSRILLGAWNISAVVQVEEGVSASVLGEEVEVSRARAAYKDYFATRRSCDLITPIEFGAARERENQSNQVNHTNQDNQANQGAHSKTCSADGLQRGLLRVMKDGALPHFIPDRREALLSSLAQLGEPCVDRLSTRLWGCVVIDGSKCSSCRMCATFCPTGALRKFDNEDGTFGIDHFPSDCVKCGSCHDICTEDAIVILDEVHSQFLMEGACHHYAMKPRPVELGNAHQILNTMRHALQGTDIFER